jgi:hypothetical protein
MNEHKLSIIRELLDRTRCEYVKDELMCYACIKIGEVFRDLDNKGWIINPPDEVNEK